MVGALPLLPRYDRCSPAAKASIAVVCKAFWWVPQELDLGLQPGAAAALQPIERVGYRLWTSCAALRWFTGAGSLRRRADRLATSRVSFCLGREFSCEVAQLARVAMSSKVSGAAGSALPGAGGGEEGSGCGAMNWTWSKRRGSDRVAQSARCASNSRIRSSIRKKFLAIEEIDGANVPRVFP